MHFFISHLARCLRTRRFSEPTFRPSGATNHWKNTVNRDFPTFSRICIFFLLIFSLLTLLTSAFQLSILSEVSLLNFLRSIIIPIITINGGINYYLTIQINWSSNVKLRMNMYQALLDIRWRYHDVSINGGTPVHHHPFVQLVFFMI